MCLTGRGRPARHNFLAGRVGLVKDSCCVVPCQAKKKIGGPTHVTPQKYPIIFIIILLYIFQV